MVTTIAAILLSGILCLVLLALFAVLLAGGIVAGVIRRVVGMALVLALPLALSAAVVNVLFLGGEGDVLATLGPLSVTTAKASGWRPRSPSGS